MEFEALITGLILFNLALTYKNQRCIRRIELENIKSNTPDK